MKACWYEKTGAAKDVLVLGEIPAPEPGPGEVRVKIMVSAVNPSDTKGRAGWRGRPMPYPRIVPHQDGAGVIDKLVVYPEAMRKNLDRLGGLIHSQRVLLALTQKGVARDDAYAIVQRNAMRAWRNEGEFLNLLKADKDVAKVLSAQELEALFDLGYHLKHVNAIFKRVFVD